jgi:hypothetical protein
MAPGGSTGSTTPSGIGREPARSGAASLKSRIENDCAGVLPRRESAICCGVWLATQAAEAASLASPSAMSSSRSKA